MLSVSTSAWSVMQLKRMTSVTSTTTIRGNPATILVCFIFLALAYDVHYMQNISDVKISDVQFSDTFFNQISDTLPTLKAYKTRIRLKQHL